jgi:hypothetical protein
MGFKWLNNWGSKAKSMAGKIGNGIVSGAKWTGNKALGAANWVGSGVKKLNDYDNETGGHLKKGILNGLHAMGSYAINKYAGDTELGKTAQDGLNALHESVYNSLKKNHKYNSGYTKKAKSSVSASSGGFSSGVGRVADAGGDYASFGKRRFQWGNELSNKSF